MTQPDVQALKQELSTALSQYTQLLREVSFIDAADMPAFTFMMRSFGFIFERVPQILLEDDLEESQFALFQYYNLLAELKHNLAMTHPYAQLAGESLQTTLAPFPVTYATELNQWWETKTGLKVLATKQTLRA